MRASRGHPCLRPGCLNAFTAYSVGCAIAWAVVWAIAAAIDPKQTLDDLWLIFAGWVIGWTSATIARGVYPPPKKRHPAGPRCFFQGSV
jgi:hypothetical protein